MALQSLAMSQQSLSSPVLPGTWKLVAGRAVTLVPREDAVLRIAHGRVWVTLGHPPVGHGNESGDLFLGAGEQVTVQAGQRAVVEPFADAAAGQAQGAAYFSWDALPAAVRDPVRVVSRWQLAVVQPLGDLRLAFGLAGGAVGRLVFGLAGVAFDLVVAAGLSAGALRGRGGLAARAFKAQPRAMRAHGAMS